MKSVLVHAKNIGHAVKELVSDGGGEFVNEEVDKILDEFGIEKHTTAPYTPQQNGKAERENRTVVEMARTFKYSNENVVYPEEIWAELIQTAIYVLNRTAKSSEEGKSPYESWLGKVPRIKHLRIISSTAYFHVPKQKRRKMDRKAKKGVLVGYDGDLQYRIYVPEEQRVYISRDVKFQETLKNCKAKVELPSQPKSTDEESDSDEPESADNNDSFHNASDESEESEEESGPMTRARTGTEIKKPSYLGDFVCFAEIETPTTFEQAILGKEKDEWQKAMKSELQSLRDNNTWKEVNLPKGCKALPCKWVYRVKTNPDGSVDRFKARLVVKGFSQREGIDFDQTFSPVTRLATVRSVLGVAASENMKLAQFDVSTAFLYGELEEDIYMQKPEGFEGEKGKVCRLIKSLYGLKQAPRCWNKRFGNFLAKESFKTSEADSCLFVYEENGEKMLLTMYVDDGLIAYSNDKILERFLDKLKKEFKIVSKEADYYLGLEIKRTIDGITINQKGYAEKMLKKFGFDQSKPISTPMLKGSNVEQSRLEPEKEFPYRQIVGSLMYLMTATRPDLGYSIGVLSRNLENPTKEDITRAKRVLRYIKGTLDYGIRYDRISKELECYSDTDFGGCEKTARSTTGVIIKYAGGAISWLSQRQTSIALSTTEAEIVAASEAGKEIVWLTEILKSLIGRKIVPTLLIDNAAALKLSQNPEMHRRTKHIHRRHFYVRELVSKNDICVDYVPSEDQLADMMTKPLERARLYALREKVGLQNVV